jgi:uncharacterized cupredoxin-like copper-binding protein
MKMRVMAAVLMLGIVSVACGDDDGASSGASASATDGGMDMDDHGGDGGEFAFGEPGDPADADRVIEVTTSDDLQFDPSLVSVEMGETIEFQVSNPGTVAHEFVIGDEPFQEAHEDEMAEMEGDMLPPDEVYAIGLEPGETRSIAWTFSADGVVEYGCHVPGHYDAGMVGTVTVEG